MAPYLPTLQVEAAFGAGALGTSLTWVALQSGALEFSVTRGRSTEFDQFQAATGSVRFKDTDRRYDPLYSAGTYAGSLVPNVPIRITATVSGTVYPRAYGYVDSWDYDPRRNIGFTTVPFTDGFKIIAQKKLPQSVYETVVLADDPWWYIKLGEEAGPVAADSTANKNDFRWAVGPYTRGAGAVVPFGNDKSVDVIWQAGATKVAAPVRSAAGTARITTLSRTVEMWIQAPDLSRFGSSTSSGTFWLFVQGDNAPSSPKGTDIVYVYDDSTGSYLLWARAEDSTPVFTEFSVPRLHNGSAHHLVVVFTATGATAYLNGNVLTVTATAAGSVDDAEQQVWIGAPETYITLGNGTWPGLIDDVSYYDVALTAAQARAHYEAAASPWDGDFTGARISRILDLIDWPAALRDIDAGEIVLGPADLAGQNALAYLQLIAASEGGRLFMSNDGKVTFHGAAAVRANTTAEATFSDDGADNPYLYGSLRFSKNDRSIVNEASVQRKYGLPQTATDTTSTAAYGTKTKTLSGLLMQTDAQARNRAEQLVYRYKDPQVRVDSWTVNPQAKPAQWQQHLALELGDHVQLEVKPANVGTRDTIQMDLEQIREQATPSKYEFTLVGSPRDPNVANYLTWGGTLSSQSWGTGCWA